MKIPVVLSQLQNRTLLAIFRQDHKVVGGLCNAVAQLMEVTPLRILGHHHWVCTCLKIGIGHRLSSGKHG